tara:strand:+ start:3938 stop:6334 length:2397 start_codon:yes stop_codon:yes gene_type:complete
MAYGDLKCRNLIWNSGSGDNTVVVNTLATTSNPTFTGTVTVPTATAGDNSTKAASTAFVVASFALKASPTFTGTVTVPTAAAGDNSTKAASTAFVVTSFALKASPTFTGTVTVPTASADDNTTKAASTAYVQTELGDYAPKANPAFTGTATGVNLTLSGDLTVNGTTTTINTTTLQVEDKNIEIGKVASPSDTTADGGGWSLLGSTTKTFNWVNATDAWTSSEHIHLIDNKKLFVGGASGTTDGLEIVHNASDSILNDTGTGALKLQLGGATKLEIQSGGINVTGVINVNGAALSTAPEITATASGSIGANTATIINSNGTVSAIVGASDTQGSEFTINDGGGCRNYATVYDPDNERVVLFFHKENAGGDCYYQVGTVASSGTSVTWGTAAVFSANNGDYENINAIYDTNENLIYVAFIMGSNSNVRVRACKITQSGGSPTNSLTIGDLWEPNGGSYIGSADNVCIAWNSDLNHALIAWSENSRSRFQAFSYAASNLDTPSSGSMVSMPQYSGVRDAIYDTASQRYLVIYNSDGGSINQSAFMPIVEGSSYGLTAGTYNQGFKAGDAWPMSCAWDSVNNRAWVVWLDRSGSTTNRKLWGAYATSTGGTITYGTHIELATGVYQGSNNQNSTVRPNIHTEFNPDTGEMNTFYMTSTNYPILVRSTFNSDGSATKKAAWQLTVDAGGSSVSGPYSQYVPNVRRFIVLWNDGNAGDECHGKVITTANTTLNSHNFIGFNKNSVTNGQTSTIQINSAVSTQSSLTPGAQYYVQAGGTLGTTAADPSVKAGVALSATQLLIRT